MLKFEHSGNRVHCEAGGDVVEICADVNMCIGVLHKSLHDKDKKLASGFRRMLVQSLVDDDCPAWHPELIPEANRAVTAAPGLESLLAELDRRKNEGDDK